MISLVKPTPPKKIKAEIKQGYYYVKGDLCRCFLVRKVTTAEKFAKNFVY